MQRISWIGVGIMGKAMVRNLMKAGYEVHIYARHPEKVADVISEGAVPHGSIAECVKASEVVITMVGFPKDVEEVYFAPGNILDSAAKGMTLIDMTTTSPLSILVGGDQADFDACLPIFQAMGTNITYFGPAGCGQHAKMANQIMIAGALSGVCEALAYAKAEGLDGNTLLGAVSTGAAGSKQLDFQGKKILTGDFAPGFFMKHFVKDMRLAEEEAENAGLDLNVLQQALSNCQSLIDRGCGCLLYTSDAADE